MMLKNSRPFKQDVKCVLIYFSVTGDFNVYFSSLNIAKSFGLLSIEFEHIFFSSKLNTKVNQKV